MLWCGANEGDTHMNQRDRLDGILAAMEGDNLDAVIAFSDAAHHVDFGDAVALLTGFKPLGPCVAVLHRDGRVVLAVSPAWDAARAEDMATADEIVPTDDLDAAFAKLFAGANLRVGAADLGKMRHTFAEAASATFSAAPRDVSAWLFNLGRRKTDDELANARKATEIAEQAYHHLLAIAEPGMPECRLAAELKNCTRRLGADDNFMMFHAEAHPLAVQPSGERPLEKGDLILAEITPSYRGQYAQICRTACLGQPTDAQAEKYELVVRAMKNGISHARAGVAMKEICLGVDEVLRDAGYGDYCEPPYMNRRGHGLGIASTAPGNVALTNDTNLEDGMFFVVHPNQYIPEVGYLLCGEPIAIRPDGADVLSRDYAALGSIAV